MMQKPILIIIVDSDKLILIIIVDSDKPILIIIVDSDKSILIIIIDSDKHSYLSFNINQKDLCLYSVLFIFMLSYL